MFILLLVFQLYTDFLVDGRSLSTDLLNLADFAIMRNLKKPVFQNEFELLSYTMRPFQLVLFQFLIIYTSLAQCTRKKGLFRFQWCVIKWDVSKMWVSHFLKMHFLTCGISLYGRFHIYKANWDPQPQFILLTPIISNLPDVCFNPIRHGRHARKGLATVLKRFRVGSWNFVTFDINIKNTCIWSGPLWFLVLSEQWVW